MSRYDENLSYIFDAPSEDDRQLQIIEESAEFIVAICKMIRARKGTNPTPVTTKQARAMMLEEFADVAVSMEANTTAQEINRIKLEKAERWVNRIKETNRDIGGKTKMQENDRLTHKRANGIKDGYWSAATKERLVQRLAAYENTGLEPCKIRQLLDAAANLAKED